MIPFAVSMASDYADIVTKGEDFKHVYWAMAGVIGLIVLFFHRMMDRKWYLHVSYAFALRFLVIGLGIAACVVWYGNSGEDGARAQALKSNIQTKYYDVHAEKDDLEKSIHTYLIGEGGDIEFSTGDGRKFILVANGENEPTVKALPVEGAPVPLTRAEYEASQKK